MILQLRKEKKMVNQNNDSLIIGIGDNRRIRCVNPNTGNYFNLDLKYLQLFQIIAYQGFMTLQQMNKLYALITNDKSKYISKHTLSRWTSSKKGIFNKTMKSHHNMYRLNTWMIDWLIKNNFLEESDVSLRQRNIHNLLLVESIVNGIYYTWCTCLKSPFYQRLQSALENGFALLAVVRNIKNESTVKQIIEYNNKHNCTFEQLSHEQGLPSWLYGLDLRSYNRQLGITSKQARSLFLKPDALLKFGNTVSYIELDNRNENNFTLIEKIMTYIEHASNHPKVKMNLLIVFNDGSLNNDRITQYKIPTTKLNAIVQATVAQQMTFKNKTIQVFKAYKKTPNLSIYLSPLGESYIDFADILLNENIITKCIRSLKYWSANLKPPFHAKLKLSKDQSRYHRVTAEGYLLLNNSTKKTPKLQFIFGQEHKIDTAISTLIAYNKASSLHAAPIIVLPVREKAITLVMFKSLIKSDLKRIHQFNFNTIGIIQQTLDYDYSQPTVKVLNSPLAEGQNKVPFNSKYIQ